MSLYFYHVLLLFLILIQFYVLREALQMICLFKCAIRICFLFLQCNIISLCAAELPGGDVAAARGLPVAVLESGAGRPDAGSTFPRTPRVGGARLPDVPAQVQLLPQLRREQHVRSAGARAVLTGLRSVSPPQVGQVTN